MKNRRELSGIIIGKCIDVLIQFSILAFFIYYLLTSQYNLSQQGFEDYSTFYFLPIGFYQLISFFIHLVTFKNEARLRIARLIYFVLIPLFFCAVIIYLKSDGLKDLNFEFIIFLHALALCYLAISITETVGIILLAKKRQLFLNKIN